jgi:hypothetical protein
MTEGEESIMPTLRLTYDEERRVEGYAKALEDLTVLIMGEGFSAKSYDPMTVEGTVMHSYAFNMKDGGRHHPVRDYKSVEEIYQTLLNETVQNLREEGAL